MTDKNAAETISHHPALRAGPDVVSYGDSARSAAGNAVAVSGESAALISMIERAARDPSVDLDKMERLFAMHERVQQQRAKADYLAALSIMQPSLPVVNKRGEIDRKAKDDSGTKQTAKPTKYAKWEDVVEAVNPVLTQNGFSLSFRIAQPSPERIVVTAVLGHRGGHSEETSMSLSIDNTGAKNNVQGWGSSVSYGKRYTAFALLNIVARGEDDDGEAAGKKADTTTPEQRATELRDLIARAGASEGKVCERHSVECLEDLPAKDYEAAKAGLFAMIRKKQGAK